MATRTYSTGQNSGVRRLDNLTGAWIDIPLNLLDISGNPIDTLLRDVMTDPNDENKVFVVGARDEKADIPGIYWSNDAGVTWNKALGDIATVINCPMIWEVWAVDSNTIYATGSGGYLFKSTDGGITFDETTVAPTISGSSGDITYRSRALHFPDVNNGVVLAEAGVGQHYAFLTTDGGASWSNVDLTAIAPISLQSGKGVHMSADTQVITALHGAAIYRTTDGGASWAIVYTWLSRIGEHLTWTDDNNIWGYAGEGERVRSTDAGATWTVIGASTPGGPVHRAGHHYQGLNGFYSSDNDTLSTSDGSVTGTFSEASPYGITAVWTHYNPEPAPCGCPAGYTYNAVTGFCEQTLTTPPICSPSFYVVGPGDDRQFYGNLGTNFYDDATGRPFPIQEVSNMLEDASSSVLSIVGNVQNAVWGSPIGFTGRLNQVGVWATTVPLPNFEWIGFSACVTVPTDGVYSIGVGADNYCRVRIDGVPFLEMATGSTFTYNYWHVVPITLTAGTHIIEMEGLNLGGPAAFGAEIYDTDVATLMAITTNPALAAVTIFSTLNQIGQLFPLSSSDAFGCSCPPGYAYNTCGAAPQCTLIDQVPFVPCNCYLATNCDDPLETMLISIDPVLPPLDVNQIYTFTFDPAKCWIIEVSDQCDPLATFEVVVDSFIDCQTCLGICYEFVDCEGNEATFISNEDYSAYVGQVVNISTCPDICWQVNQISCPPLPYDSESVVITNTHVDCAACIPPPPPPPPLTINNRRVKPGYNTPACTPEYVEKVSCNYSEALYQRMASVRFGVEFCCETDLQKWSIKKELLDLDLITDPEACVTDTSACDCCAPCNVRAEIIRFATFTCDPPTNLGAILTIP